VALNPPVAAEFYSQLELSSIRHLFPFAISAERREWGTGPPSILSHVWMERSLSPSPGRPWIALALGPQSSWGW
jgi:hypothetical protein